MLIDFNSVLLNFAQNPCLKLIYKFKLLPE